jgi:hypothetical protein
VGSVTENSSASCRALKITAQNSPVTTWAWKKLCRSRISQSKNTVTNKFLNKTFTWQKSIHTSKAISCLISNMVATYVSSCNWRKGCVPIPFHNSKSSLDLSNWCPF